jgi:hypothetical protein
MAYLAGVVGIVILAPQDINGVPHAAKRSEPAGDGEIYTGRYEQNYKRQSPDDINNGGPETVE